MGQETETRTRRSLFWRLWFRALTVKRPQAALAAGSLLAGAAVMSMLLNLYTDVRRKMTQEFRAYGANVVLAPGDGAGLMDESVVTKLDSLRQRSRGLAVVPVLYLVTKLEGVPARRDPMENRLPESVNVAAVGADFAGLQQMNSGWRLVGNHSLPTGRNEYTCAIGAHLASTLHLGPGDAVRLLPIGPGPSVRESPDPKGLGDSGFGFRGSKKSRAGSPSSSANPEPRIPSIFRLRP